MAQNIFEDLSRKPFARALGPAPTVAVIGSACGYVGGGVDRAIAHIRDNIYLKEVINEKVSSAPDLARRTALSA